MLKLNTKAPDFSLSDQNGKIHSLSDNKGKWTLLYFYPKDDTPGCTKEACSLRDNWPVFKKFNCIVWGISVDSVKSHKKFSDKYKLPFILLSDEKKEVVKLYGAWQKKNFMGREYMGAKRTSYLINPKGFISKIYLNVDPANHAGEVLKNLRS